MSSDILFKDDSMVFGLLMISLGLVFYTESLNKGFWPKFYKIVPGLFMAYLIPAVLTSFGIIAPEWESVNSTGELIIQKSNLYYL